MNTAQKNIFKKTKNITSITVLSFVGLTAVTINLLHHPTVINIISAITPQAQAQTTSNPFVPTSPATNSTEEIQQLILPENNSEQPVLYNSNDTTNTTLQNQVALTAIPPRLGDDGTLRAAPGEKLQVQLRVRNISEETVSVTTSAQDFILDTDGETPVPVDDSISNRWSLANWLTITPTEHVITPKSTIGINVLVEIPEDALPGGHYAMVLHEPFGTLSEPGLNGSNTGINQRVGTLLYIIVEGPINEEAYVRNFTFPKFSEYGPVPFSFTIENNSDVHITPQMSVEIFNLFGQKLDTITIEHKNIFPLTSRNFTGSWDRIWGWGLYKAQLTASYGSSGTVIVANTNFWLLPIKIIIATISLVLIVLFALLATKRHLKHKKSIEEKRIAELESQIEEMQSK